MVTLRKTWFVWSAVTSVSLLSCGLRAQVDDQPAPVPLAPKRTYLKPGMELRGSMGRVVRNADQRKGSYRVCVSTARASSPATKNRPAIKKGQILCIIVPKAQAAKHVVVDSGGLPTAIVVNGSPGGRTPTVVVSTTGGQVTLEFNGHGADATMGGTGNTVTMNGRNNTGRGLDHRSAGTVIYSATSRGCSWAGAPGSWASRSGG